MNAERIAPPDPRGAAKILEARSAARIGNMLKLAANPTRIRILMILGSATIGVTDLAAMVGLTQPAMSIHMKLLTVSRLVEPRREGIRVYYELTDLGRKLLAAIESLA